MTLAIFTTMLALVVWRPRGVNEAWWTVLAAAAMLSLKLVSPREAIDAVVSGKNALLFLLSLLALSLLIGKSGFFDWTAIRCARLAQGSGRALYRNVFVLGAVITAVLSLDTTAVMLTPVVLALVRRLKLPAAPYIVMSAFIANVGSLALPISNLTNILFADTFHLTFGAFVAKMLGAQGAALAVTYALLRAHFRRDLPLRFDDEALPPPASVIPNRPYFILCVVVLGVVLAGYFFAPLLGVAPYAIAFAGSAVLAGFGALTGRVRASAVGEMSWSVFPFVVGLFVAVRGLEDLGIVDISTAWLSRRVPDSPETLCAIAGATALASNVMNNLPAALVARTVLAAAHAPTATVLAALIGTDVGPMVTPFGSLATMLVLALARREGQEMRTDRLVTLGLWTAPLIVAGATLALIVELSFR